MINGQLHALQTDPQRPGLAVEIDFEKAAVSQLSELRVPPSLRRQHEDALAVWQRRLALLTSIHELEPRPLQDKAELDREFAEPNALAVQEGSLFSQLGISECDLTK
jgi:hypothetical protein